MTATNQHTERLKSVDIIRGIALLGILIVNIQTYTLFAFLKPADVYTFHLDRQDIYAPIQFLINVLIKGQFYTIYSFLFGLGCFLMLQKNKRVGLNGEKIYTRKLCLLLLLGITHGLIFWFGDILHKYAILGFSLLYFQRKSITVILRWIIGITVFIVAFQIVKACLLPPDALQAAINENRIKELTAEVMKTWQYGSFLRVVSLQKTGVIMLWMMSFQNGCENVAHYLIMFLLGLIAGKMQFFQHINLYRKRLTGFAFRMLPIGLVLKCIHALPVIGIQLFPAGYQEAQKLFLSLAGFIGTPLLTITYLIFLANGLRKNNAVFFTWIGNAGRLSLTNYLVQTLLCTLLFYGYAGGLSGRLSLIESFVPVILIYSFQVLYSNLWLKYRKAGPVETLWRRMSLYKLAALKNDRRHPARKTMTRFLLKQELFTRDIALINKNEVNQ